MWARFGIKTMALACFVKVMALFLRKKIARFGTWFRLLVLLHIIERGNCRSSCVPLFMRLERRRAPKTVARAVFRCLR